MSRAAPSSSRIRRSWLVDMGIAIGTNKRGDFDPVAADIASEIGKNRKSRDNRQFGRSLRAGGRRADHIQGNQNTSYNITYTCHEYLHPR